MRGNMRKKNGGKIFFEVSVKNAGGLVDFFAISADSTFEEFSESQIALVSMLQNQVEYCKKTCLQYFQQGGSLFADAAFEPCLRDDGLAVSLYDAFSDGGFFLAPVHRLFFDVAVGLLLRHF